MTSPPIIGAAILCMVAEPAPVEIDAGPTVADLVATAEGYGVDRAALLVAVRHYCGGADLDHLRTDQVASLLDRMHARYGTSGDSAPIADVEVKPSKRSKKKAA